MTDLISRADAIEAIKKYNFKIPPYMEEVSEGFITKLRDAMKTDLIGDIQSLPSADAEWIPCSERLPKAEDMYQPPEQRYLCQLEAYGVRKFCVLSRLKGAVSPFWDWYGIAVYDSDVIAWMPLPEPYRKDGEA